MDSAKALASDFESLMSQAGVWMLMPLALISLNRTSDGSLTAPERESKIKFLAPRATIHWLILRPKPPKPPDMRYVALGSK